MVHNAILHDTMVHNAIVHNTILLNTILHNTRQRSNIILHSTIQYTCTKGAAYLLMWASCFKYNLKSSACAELVSIFLVRHRVSDMSWNCLTMSMAAAGIPVYKFSSRSHSLSTCHNIKTSSSNYSGELLGDSDQMEGWWWCLVVWALNTTNNMDRDGFLSYINTLDAIGDTFKNMHFVLEKLHSSCDR